MFNKEDILARLQNGDSADAIAQEMAAALNEAQTAFDTKPMLLFTNYEETGGYGMKTFIESKLLDPFRNIINLAVSVDRKGHNQWVCYYNNDDYDLEEFMLRLGYVEEVGSWTDGAGLAAA